MYVWEVEFPPVNKSGTRCGIEIRSGHNSFLYQELNVTFGDVWFCTGQSNMGFTMAKLKNTTSEMEMGKLASFFLQKTPT